VFIVDRDIMLDFSEFTSFLFVSTSATDCLERLVSEMACYVSSGMSNSSSATMAREFQGIFAELLY